MRSLRRTAALSARHVPILVLLLVAAVGLHLGGVSGAVSQDAQLHQQQQSQQLHHRQQSESPPPADYDNFHYVALRLDTAGWPADPQLRAARARRIGHELQLQFARPVGELPDYFLFAAPKTAASTSSAFNPLFPRQVSIGGNVDAARLQRRCAEHHRVLWHELQLPSRRLFRRAPAPIPLPVDAANVLIQRLGINDPRFRDQWHLFNIDQPGHDLNLSSVWLQNITGVGVTVGFIDDGLDYKNPDLRDNYTPVGSYDFNFHKSEPMPSMPEDTHGTRCAGEVAAVKNDVCGVGIAWSAKIAGIRILSAEVSHADEAASINYGFNTTHIYSCSWGPRDDGMTMDAPPDIVKAAFRNGIDRGRNGLGSVFVFAAGNGGIRDDNCNYDGYTNSIFTVTVSAMDRTEVHPVFSESCPANLISMWSGQNGLSGIVTSDWIDGCTDRHGGTSAAAPLAAGVYALVLSIRPDLTWRDIQRLTVDTAYPINAKGKSWEKTAAGRLYSHRYGYGTLDAYAIVEAAKTFRTLGPHTSLTIPSGLINTNIPPSNSTEISNTLTVTQAMVDAARLARLEHVTVTVDIKHDRRGDVAIHLVSPASIRSRLIEGRMNDEATTGFPNWTMMSVMHWDESVVGDWKLVVIDKENPEKRGYWNSWSVTFWGEAPRNATGDQGHVEKPSSSVTATVSATTTTTTTASSSTTTTTTTTHPLPKPTHINPPTQPPPISKTPMTNHPTDNDDSSPTTTTPPPKTSSFSSFLNLSQVAFIGFTATLLILGVGVSYFAYRFGWIRASKKYRPVGDTDTIELEQGVSNRNKRHDVLTPSDFD